MIMSSIFLKSNVVKKIQLLALYKFTSALDVPKSIWGVLRAPFTATFHMDFPVPMQSIILKGATFMD